jgi:DNA-binding NarL/FixJ family response regulator
MNTAAYRILLVDDHAMVRRGLRELIRDHFPDAVCQEADSAPMAIEQIHREDWDLVLLDINLPGRSGLDLLTEIRGLRADLPVLVLSMHPEDQYALRCLRAGANGYITKDRADRELAGAIVRVLQGGRYVSRELGEELALQVAVPGDRPRHASLSSREFEVFLKLAGGVPVKEIAAMLSLSVKTISTYRTRVLQKLGLRTNADLMKYALRHDLLP